MAADSRRTCLGCRVRKNPIELVRMVLETGAQQTPGPPRLKWDPGRRAPGRGAWLCPSESCLKRVLGRPGIFSRALLRNQGSLDLTALAQPPWRPPTSEGPNTPSAGQRRETDQT